MSNRRLTNRRRFLKYSGLGLIGTAGVTGLTILLDKLSSPNQPANNLTQAVNPVQIAAPSPSAVPTRTAAPTRTASPAQTAAAASAGNSVISENSQPGSPNWLITRTGDDIQRQIKGYASATSVNKGGSIDFHVSVNPPQNFTMEVYRIGWYNGTGGRLMQTVGSLNGSTYSVPAPDSLGTVACDWPVAYTLNIPAGWTSGVYLVKLMNSQGWQNYIHFVVRDDGRAADLVFQSSITTYHAYDAFGSKSLYPDNSVGGNAARKVSLDRPYSNTGMGQFFMYEMPTLRFLEKNGYDVVYCTNIDLHTNPKLMDNRKGFLSVGHDEYWSMEMYDNALEFRKQGKHLAFLGADAIYWQIRFESSASGVPNRIITCYKGYYMEDPHYPGPTTTYLWRQLPPVNTTTSYSRPEHQLIGVMFDGWENDNVGQPYVVENSDHWAYEGTGFKNGSTVPGIVGYEWDRRFKNDLEPAGLVQLSNSGVENQNKTNSVSHSTIYQASSGSWVFATGTIYWSYALDFCGFQTTDLRNAGIQRVTRNVLDRFITD